MMPRRVTNVGPPKMTAARFLVRLMDGGVQASSMMQQVLGSNQCRQA